MYNINKRMTHKIAKHESQAMYICKNKSLLFLYHMLSPISSE